MRGVVRSISLGKICHAIASAGLAGAIATQQALIFRPYSETALRALPNKLSAPNSRMTAVGWEYVLHRILLHDPLPYLAITISGLKRARRHLAGQDADFLHVKELWWPEAKYVQNVGRLNDIGQPRFYAAEDASVALVEMRPLPGDVFSVLVIRKKNVEPIPVTVLGLSRSRMGATIRSLGEVQRYYDSIVESITAEKYARFLFVEHWFTQLITQKVPLGSEVSYVPTVALANMLLNKIPGFPNGRSKAIVYPSVAADFVGDNVCVNAADADELFLPHAAWKLQFLGYQQGHSSSERCIAVKLLKRSRLIGEDGKIDWYPPGYGFGAGSIRALFGGRGQISVTL